METRIDRIAGGIHRISAYHPAAGITFNQFLIDDERPALIHTGMWDDYESIRGAIRQVLDRFMAEARGAVLAGSALSVVLNAHGFGLPERVRGVSDGDRLELGHHTLRFLETPHVHHWDSMMVDEESTNSLFPSDLFLQPGDQPPVVRENLGAEMVAAYRAMGIFAHEDPVRAVAQRVAALAPDWIHAMHGGTIEGDALPALTAALHEHEFAYRGLLLGREVNRAAMPAATPRT